MSSDIAIRATNLTKHYLIYKSPADRLRQFIFRRRRYFSEFVALSDVSLTIKRGETVGIVGQNGSGKSTLLQIICGTLTPTGGEVKVNGRISALLELGTGFNPEFTGAENINLSATIQGLSVNEIKEKYNSIIEFSGLSPEHIAQPVKTYSSGMYVRLAFAVAIASDPDILIVDEALAVGDEAFQRKCFSRIREIKRRGGTVVLVSHSAANVMEICDRAILLDSGELLAAGAPKDIISRYHKLIFAPGAKKSAVREDIKNSRNMNAESDFNPDLIPETTLAYESRGAIINNTCIENAEGSPVNILERGKEYYFRYRINFERDCFGVRAGMMIKTKTGIELGGATTSSETKAIEKISAGSSIEASFKFKALLAPGTYFLNAGCSGLDNGERVFLHRLSDTLMFKVLPEAESKITGMVDFMVEPEIQVMRGAREASASDQRRSIANVSKNLQGASNKLDEDRMSESALSSASSRRQESEREAFIDFLGIGAQKAGTTWLYEHLQEQPEIFMPDVKEVHFWDEKQNLGLDWYKSQFAGRQDRICGEITPAYAILPKETIKKIYGLNPNLKLIFIMRDPIERAWSAALMALERSQLKFSEVSDQWFIDHFHSQGSLARGDYAACISNWRKVFPSEQLLILDYEDIAKSPEKFLQKVFSFLGISSPKPIKNAGRKVFASQNHPLPGHLRKILKELYHDKKFPLLARANSPSN